MIEAVYRKVKCPDCAWNKFQDGEVVGMTPCSRCGSTGYVYEPVEPKSDNRLLTTEERYLFDSIISARKVQQFLWGFVNADWGLEEWRRMFRKRLSKIDDITLGNPHWKVELKKRLLQNTALGIALLALLEIRDLKEGIHSDIPSNLEEYKAQDSFYQE